MSRRADHGFASILVLVGGSLLLVVIAVVTVAGSLLATRARATTAADLAALAASAQALGGSGPACAQAASVTAANGGRMLSCHLGGELGLDADVEVAVAVGPALRGVMTRFGLAPPTFRARAVAGPPR